jgi:RHS repeat-associated protein
MLMPGRKGHVSSDGSGSWVVGPGLSANLVVDQRVGTGDYVATNSIDFVTGFVSATGDRFDAYISQDLSAGGGTGYGNAVDEGYRYGFNGQEKSQEIGFSHYTAQFWEYDARIGRRWNNDPLPKMNESPYAAFANNPVSIVDYNGADTTLAQNKTGNLFIWLNYNRDHIDYKAMQKQKSFDFIEVNNIDALKSRVADYMKQNKIAGLHTVFIKSHGNTNQLLVNEITSFLGDQVHQVNSHEGMFTGDAATYMESMKFLASNLLDKGKMLWSACHAGDGNMPHEMSLYLSRSLKASVSFYFNRDMSVTYLSTSWDFHTVGDMGRHRNMFSRFDAPLTEDVKFRKGWSVVNFDGKQLEENNRMYLIKLSSTDVGDPIKYLHTQ